MELAGVCQTLAACWGLAAPHLTPSPDSLVTWQRKQAELPPAPPAMSSAGSSLHASYPALPPPGLWVTSGFCCSRFEHPEPGPSSRRAFLSTCAGESGVAMTQEHGLTWASRPHSMELPGDVERAFGQPFRCTCI